MNRVIGNTTILKTWSKKKQEKFEKMTFDFLVSREKLVVAYDKRVCIEEINNVCDCTLNPKFPASYVCLDKCLHEKIFTNSESRCPKFETLPGCNTTKFWKEHIAKPLLGKKIKSWNKQVSTVKKLKQKEKYTKSEEKFKLKQKKTKLTSVKTKPKKFHIYDGHLLEHKYNNTYKWHPLTKNIPKDTKKHKLGYNWGRSFWEEYQMVGDSGSWDPAHTSHAWNNKTKEIDAEWLFQCHKQPYSSK